MRFCLAGAASCWRLILLVITVRGLPALSWEMLTQSPQGGFYLGKGGGILNAIVGSLYLAVGATALAAVFAAPTVLYLHVYAPNTRFAALLRLALDVMWGIPSIVYGAFGFTFMVFIGHARFAAGRASSPWRWW